MKTSALDRNGIPSDLVDLVSRLVDLIPWPERRRAMGDVALAWTASIVLLRTYLVEGVPLYKSVSMNSRPVFPA